MPRVTALLDQEGLIRTESGNRDAEPPDLIRDPLTLPAALALRLRNPARGDKGFVLALGTPPSAARAARIRFPSKFATVR
jgi:alpha-D-ribose 1-methylphosphonate 5-triphosphate synthase subunit PhnI